MSAPMTDPGPCIDLNSPDPFVKAVLKEEAKWEPPHVPAAFINAIAEEGTKDEAIHYLQKQWNENCHLRAQLAAAEATSTANADRARLANQNLRQMDAARKANLDRAAAAETKLASAEARIDRQARSLFAIQSQLASARKALETAAGRFNMLGGVGLVNGVDPRVGYREAMEALLSLSETTGGE